MTEPKVYFDFAMATITRKVYVSHAKKATYSVLKVVEIVINTQVPQLSKKGVFNSWGDVNTSWRDVNTSCEM